MQIAQNVYMKEAQKLHICYKKVVLFNFVDNLSAFVYFLILGLLFLTTANEF